MEADSEDQSVIAVLVVEEPVRPGEAPTQLSASGSDAVTQDGLNVRRFELKLCEGQSLRVGRANTNDLPLKNRNVSRFHAVFSASASGVVLSDLSSLNGTLVNGSRISTPVDLSSGDVVLISDARIHVKLTLGEERESDSTHGRTQTAQLAAVVVTVLVADVVGYTKLSEALPPQDVANMMHEWFQEVSQIVKDNGGEVDKYIGDCVMALWRGSHQNAEELATKAVKAGVCIQRETEVLSERLWSHRAIYPWKCRIALNTGEALMGTVGGAGKRDFTVLGDTVNIAFRLESVAGKLGTSFIFSRATADFIQKEIPVKGLGDINVEGRQGQVSVFTLA